MSRSVLIGLVAIIIALAALASIAWFVSQGTKRPEPSVSPVAKGGPIPMPFGGGPPGGGGSFGPKAQEKGGGAAGGGMGGGMGGGGFRRIIEQAGGTEEDAAKVTAFFDKRQANTAELREALNRLRELSADEKATDQQVAAALADFRKKRDKAKSQLEADRKALARDLRLEKRPRLEAALTVLGVLDNGLAGARMMRMGQGGPGGGMGGGMPGGPGGGIGGPGMGGPGAPKGGPAGGATGF